MAINIYLSIITLTVNGLNALIKRHREEDGAGLPAGFWPCSVSYLLGLPPNTMILFVPQQGAWEVKQMGQFLVTLNNVTLQIDELQLEDPEYAITQLAQRTIRSELGKLSLDKVFQEVHAEGGRVRGGKWATVLESEGIQESSNNLVKGKNQAYILASQAEKPEQINKAAKAKAKILAAVLTQHNGDAAASLTVAEQYFSVFSKFATDVYGTLAKVLVPEAQESVSSGSSSDVQVTDASLGEEFK
ncbi:unnamed protein product [Nyctereutes procyonoides]|uniref:(raccoon dog) hypothetical protein n=1 Tax=Nyctereutes procyonoides TaxID=34880 RepID=A0A811YXR4_NYCPR|nr:unnamed protein product [Nyctereutes procyonoides]